MKTLTDTSRRAREIQIAAYRSLGGTQRLLAALEMSEEARGITSAGFRARHPEWSAMEVDRAVAAVLLSPGVVAEIE